MIIKEYSHNNWSLLPFINTLLEELREEIKRGKSNRFYSLLLAILRFIQDEHLLKGDDSEFLLSIITSILFDESESLISFLMIDSPPVLYDRLLLSYLILYRDSVDSNENITQVLLIIFKRTMPSSELISAVFSIIPDLFINQLVQCIKQ